MAHAAKALIFSCKNKLPTTWPGLWFEKNLHTSLETALHNKRKREKEGVTAVFERSPLPPPTNGHSPYGTHLAASFTTYNCRGIVGWSWCNSWLSTCTICSGFQLPM